MNRIAAVIDSHDATAEGTASAYSDYDQPTSLRQQQTVPLTVSNDREYNQDRFLGFSSSDLRSLSIVSDSLPRFRFPEDDHAHETTASSSGFLVSDSDQDLTSGDLLHLNLVSIPSNFLSGNAEINSRESRRNSRRLFWDALSRHSFRRHDDSPTIVFATGLAEDLGSHDRWLLDFSGDLHYDGAGHDHPDTFGARLRRRNERRWLLRSEVRLLVNYLFLFQML